MIAVFNKRLAGYISKQEKKFETVLRRVVRMARGR